VKNPIPAMRPFVVEMFWPLVLPRIAGYLSKRIL